MFSLALTFTCKLKVAANSTFVFGYKRWDIEHTLFVYCCFSELFRILHSNGTEVFNHEGCQSSLPYGTSLEVPIGITNHIILQIVLEYRWSAVKLEYDISSQGLDSGLWPKKKCLFVYIYFPIYLLSSLLTTQISPLLHSYLCFAFYYLLSACRYVRPPVVLSACLSVSSGSVSLSVDLTSCIYLSTNFLIYLFLLFIHSFIFKSQPSFLEHNSL